MIGSLNKTKINAVKSVFTDIEVIAKEVHSGVSEQPVGDEETMNGAINRAHQIRKQYPQYMSVGLEGCVMFVQNQLFLCNWGALISAEGKLFNASGARIKLPDSFKEPLNDGMELSDIMNKYTRKNGIRNHEGAIGIFTAGLVLRHEMFSHVVTLLKGQLSYNKS